MNAASAVIDFVDNPHDADRLASFPASSIRSARGAAETGADLLVDSWPVDVMCNGMVGRLVALARVCAEITMLASTDSTVLICCENVIGNELIAQAVHNLSARRANVFFKVN